MLKEHDVFAAIPAQDMDRAREFYEKKLGLEAEVQNDGVLYSCGKTAFFVFRSTGAPSGTHTQMGWSVKDIEAEVEQLKKSGVRFEEYDLENFKTENSIVNMQGVKAAWFKDSEGNLLAIQQLQETAAVGSSSRNDTERRSA